MTFFFFFFFRLGAIFRIYFLVLIVVVVVAVVVAVVVVGVGKDVPSHVEIRSGRLVLLPNLHAHHGGVEPGGGIAVGIALT